MAVARGVSTVLDVGLACLLVTASATLLITTVPSTPAPPAADRVGRALLPSTVTVETHEQPLETSVADLLVDAANNGGLTPPVRRIIQNRTRAIHARTQLYVTGSTERTTVRLGPDPPPGVAIDAAVFRLGNSSRIVVRTWSA